MKKYQNTVQFFRVLCFILCVSEYTNALKVSIYYEALCPDSVRFIGRQLYPHWNELADYIDELELVPYGKAIHVLNPANATLNIPAHYQFSCQHGPNECRGNKYQACALAQNKGKFIEVPLIYCIMKNRDPSTYDIVQSCSERYRLDITKLKACCESEEGDKLLALKGDRTWQLEPSISFVPTIVFDDKFDATTQGQSLKDFVAVVCSKIKSNAKPSICEGKRLPIVEDDFY